MVSPTRTANVAEVSGGVTTLGFNAEWDATRLELTLGGGEPATAAIAVTRVRPMLMSFPGDCFVLFSPTYSEKETRAIFAGASLLRFETNARPQGPLKANSPTPTADPCPLRGRWRWLTSLLNVLSRRTLRFGWRGSDQSAG